MNKIRDAVVFYPEKCTLKDYKGSEKMKEIFFKLTLVNIENFQTKEGNFLLTASIVLLFLYSWPLSKNLSQRLYWLFSWMMLEWF